VRLYVNIDHVATVRQARRTDEPDPVRAAVICELAGADGITVHLREDRRHIQDRDVQLLAATIRSVLNLELAASPEVVGIATELAPHQATLVPERREEVTTEGGLDLRRGGDRLRDAIDSLSKAGIRVSLFIDPTPEAVNDARALGVPAVELHTGRYANHWRDAEPFSELAEAAAQAKALGLAVHAGHGLTYENVVPVAAIPEVEELNIGHSIVSRSVFTGLGAAVRDMRALVAEGRARLR
jgi:pyridoxine 5-phosphate synthase